MEISCFAVEFFTIKANALTAPAGPFASRMQAPE
jgi:hypothetical protein